ncbi:hypothetical protein COCCU_09910 [Corynebacterium occultum]|uniref:Glycine transporter domain-containing protein n=1 Tax=Corynebacterium occultum TaxID=2675219 RepID=A0A6B8W348_9CORY|nr:trimeric intracellular cation channel family protein [Corynebacterium occultum]QGU07904.1 hypothetical protein COCCU_09910 [Corynebacterium occultum]
MPHVDPEILALYQVFDLIGVVLNGIIGGTIARQRNFDFIGFLFLALFSALGGGMLRDTLIQAGTPAAIADPIYLTLAFGGAVIALAVHFQGKTWEIFKVHGDAVILGVWAVTGCVKALSAGLPWLSAIFMGVITAVGGGMIRDICTGEVPGIFGGGPLYAVPAVLSSVSMVLFHAADLEAVGMVISPLVGIGLAVLSYWKGWVLPAPTNWAPVNMTAAQLAAALKRAEKRGHRQGRHEARREHNREQAKKNPE